MLDKIQSIVQEEYARYRREGGEITLDDLTNESYDYQFLMNRCMQRLEQERQGLKVIWLVPRRIRVYPN